MAISTFEGLSLGATNAAAMGVDFASAPAGGGSTIVADAYRGTRAVRISTGTSGGSGYIERAASVGSTSSGPVHMRMRMKILALPPDATGVRLAVITDSAGSFRGELHLNNVGQLRLRDTAGTTVTGGTSATTYVAGEWIDFDLATLVFSATIGQSRLTFFNPDGTVREQLTSPATLNTLGVGGQNKFQAGAIRSTGLNSFAVLVDDFDVSTSGIPNLPPAPTVRTGPWSGAPTPGGFTVGYRLAGGTSARLVASTAEDLTSPTLSPAVAPDSDGLVLLTVTGLNPDTTYHYGVQVDGATLAGGRGEASTAPAAGTRVSESVPFSSCVWTVPTTSTYNAILAHDDGPYGPGAFFPIMGDLGYPDWGPTVTAADVIAQHMRSLGSPVMAPLLARMPITYVPHNHDLCGDGTNRLSPALDLIQGVNRRIFPHYPYPATDGRGMYHSYVRGRIRWIALDTYSYRDPVSDPDVPGKTMLGTAQLAWLKAELLEDEPVKIICGQHPWRVDGVNSGRWGSYRVEFADINNHIATNGVQVYVIVGDAHALYADDGSAPGSYGVPQACGAPIQQGSVDIGSVWSAGVYHTAPATLQAFGKLDITDSGSEIRIDYRGITSLDGVTRIQMSTRFPVTAPPLAGGWGTRL
ncbi:hypothetical protein AB0B27_13940 [Micromonospora rifamycinica]|uniref:hypothetical protein n=1 Tax=Micromonospora rifamycinica TaxID=291594 RepID=UPI0033EFE067